MVSRKLTCIVLSVLAFAACRPAPESGKNAEGKEMVTLEGGFDSDIARSFEITGIPEPILLSPDGIIMASGPRIRGEELIKTLSSLMGSSQHE